MSEYKDTPHVEMITWLDHSAQHSSEDFTLTDIARRVKEDCTNRNVGFVVFEDETKVVIAHEARIDSDMYEPRFSHYTNILKATIKDRKHLNA